MINQVMFVAAVTLRTAAMIFALSFVIRYWHLPWRSTPEGRHLMSFSAVVACTLAVATANQLVAYLDNVPAAPRDDGAYPGRIEISVILYIWIAFEMWRRNRLLTRARRDNRRIPR